MAEHPSRSTKVVCAYRSLSEIPSGASIEGYRQFVNPLDYDFGLERGAEYQLLGAIERKGTFWLYLTPSNGDVDVGIFPSALFSFEFCMPPGMVLSVNGRFPGLAILPGELIGIPNWFELYVEGDETIVERVNALMLEARIRRDQE